MIQKNTKAKADSFVILYDEYFNIFEKFKPYLIIQYESAVFRLALIGWLPEFQSLFLKFSAFFVQKAIHCAVEATSD